MVSDDSEPSIKRDDVNLRFRKLSSSPITNNYLGATGS